MKYFKGRGTGPSKIWEKIFEGKKGIYISIYLSIYIYIYIRICIMGGEGKRSSNSEKEV